MPALLGMEHDGANLARLSVAFREMLKHSKLSLPELVLKQSKELAEQLFIETKRASAGQIWDKLQSLGWKFKRAPWSLVAKLGGGHKDIGTSDTEREAEMKKVRQRELTFAANLRKQARKLTRNNRKNKDYAKAIRIHAIATTIEGRQKTKYTLAEQRYAAYNFRKNHIGAMASSWIPAMAQLGSKMRTVAGEKRGPKMRPQCKVEVTHTPGQSAVMIINYMPGMVKLAEATDLTDTAIEKRIKDMWVYIDRKQAESATLFSLRGGGGMTLLAA